MRTRGIFSLSLHPYSFVTGMQKYELFWNWLFFVEIFRSAARPAAGGSAALASCMRRVCLVRASCAGVREARHGRGRGGARAGAASDGLTAENAFFYFYTAGGNANIRNVYVPYVLCFFFFMCVEKWCRRCQGVGKVMAYYIYDTILLYVRRVRVMLLSALWMSALVNISGAAARLSHSGGRGAQAACGAC